MKVAFDTNAYSRLMAKNEKLTECLEFAEEVYISAVVLGELVAGFRMGSRYKENYSQLNNFLAQPGIFVANIDQSVSDRYGTIVQQLKAQGTPVPTNDIWIAASALESGSRLVTYDMHFGYIPGLITLTP